MQQATGELVEIFLENGLTGGHLLCPPGLIPATGKYLLAHDGSDSPLAAPVFSAGVAAGGFLLAPPLPVTWQPGTKLSLRGPLGRGFSLPVSARKFALIALGETALRLLPLIPLALEQGREVTLVSAAIPSDLPAAVEIHSLSALAEVCAWADYLALDVPRAFLPGLPEMLGLRKQAEAWQAAQVLVHTPMPCGGLADCGVCAVHGRKGWRMACKDGPVFDLRALGL